MRGRRLVIAAMIACVLGAVSAASAGAVATIGEVSPKPESPFCLGFLPFDIVTRSVSAGPGYAVPARGGVITSWSTMGGLEEPKYPQKLGFVVIRRAGYANFTVVAEDAPKAIASERLNTFPVQIPVKGGDLIGVKGPSFIEEVGASCDFLSPGEENEEGFAEPPPAAGEAGQFQFSRYDTRTNVSATLVPPPAISSLTPAKGSATGVQVTIAGANFDQVGGVSFGGVPAKSFKVTGESEIIAMAPKAKKAGEVPVTVTTFAGTTAVPATFAYLPCKVQKPKRKSAKATRSTHTGCKPSKPRR